MHVNSGRTLGFTVTLLALLVFFVSPVGAQDRVYFPFHERSQVTITGSSTIRDWTCQGPDVRGFVRMGISPNRLNQTLVAVRNVMDGRREADWRWLASRVPLEVNGPPRVRAAIPVKSMNCGNKKMDEDMYEALKVNRQPAILYELYQVNDLTVRKASSPRHGLEYELRTTGAMAIAGTAKTIHLTLRARPEGNEWFHLEGKKKLAMSDFNITPPTAFFGLIKAYDSITIHFDLTLYPRRDEGAPNIRVANRDLKKLDYKAWLK